jgi:hypothetical protein
MMYSPSGVKPKKHRRPDESEIGLAYRVLDHVFNTDFRKSALQNVLRIATLLVIPNDVQVSHPLIIARPAEAEKAIRQDKSNLS